MKVLKFLGGLCLVYVLLVVVFESLLGYFQPANEQTLSLATTNASGATSNRVLSVIDLDGKLYVAVNHWPRNWYNNLRERPAVQVTRAGATADYIAQVVTGSEREAVDQARPLGLGFRLLTGFPPRHFVRLDPVRR